MNSCFIYKTNFFYWEKLSIDFSKNPQFCLYNQFVNNQVAYCQDFKEIDLILVILKEYKNWWEKKKEKKKKKS